MNAEKYAAGQLVRGAAHLLRDAMGELARAGVVTDEDYEVYNARTRRMDPASLDALALELENEAAE